MTEQYESLHDESRAVKIYALLGNAYKQKGMTANAVEFYEKGLRLAYDIGRYDEISQNTLNLMECLEKDDDQKKKILKEKIIKFINSKQLTYEYKKWSQI